jgi:pimeloyl-ACP methyl ester carboxylesterase
MILPLLFALIMTSVTLVLSLVLGLIMWLFHKPLERYWRKVGWVHMGLFPLHLFLTLPLVIGYVGSRSLGSRSVEQQYEGPRIDADGNMLVQGWGTLRAEQDGSAALAPGQLLAEARARRRMIDSADGVTIRAFRIEGRLENPVAVAILVHGLFRSSVELEPVARMLRDRGCECWLVDQRNHGGSSRAPFTGGLRECEDVVAVAEYIREQPGRSKTPLILFGVSFGTIAVSLALPKIENVAGVILDAPIDDLTAAAHRMMTFNRMGDKRSFTYMYEPWRSLILTSLGVWSGFSTTQVSPIEVVAAQPHDLPVLVIGEELDDRAPPKTVRNLYDRMPQHDGTKELWLVPDVTHGKAFVERPAAYDEALGRLLGRMRTH